MTVLLRGSIEQKARLVSGLIMFCFVLTHFLNHALGLYSVELMQRVEIWRLAVTRSPAGGIVLGSAIVIHILLGLRKLAFRATLKMPFWEGAQVVLGLSIPLLLIPHMVPMRFAYELFGAHTTYLGKLLSIWHAHPYQQSILLLIVWTHACIGLHFWLRLSGWYARFFLPIFALAIAVPLLALSGFMVSGRTLDAKITTSPAAAGPSYDYNYDGYQSDGYGYAGGGGGGGGGGTAIDQKAVLDAWSDALKYIFIALLALTGIVYAGRMTARHFGRRVEISYARGPTIQALTGPTLLEISRIYGVPHLSVCGGRGRCSTCRVRVEEGGENLSPRSAVEKRTLASINAGPNDRLACQIRPMRKLSVIRILRPVSGHFDNRDLAASMARGEERELAILFLDVRGFTSMSAGKLPYDVVFILNELFAATGQAIEANGGWIDKYLGDGLMAVFGRESSATSGCRQALRAAKAIDLALDKVNAAIAGEAGGAIKIGMGVHVGPLVLGEIGHSSSAAMTVIGSTVNAASRLETLTKEMKCQLIISVELAISAGLSIDNRPQQSVEVRGIPEPLDVICFAHARDLPL